MDKIPLLFALFLLCAIVLGPHMVNGASSTTGAAPAAGTSTTGKNNADSKTTVKLATKTIAANAEDSDKVKAIKEAINGIGCNTCIEAAGTDLKDDTACDAATKAQTCAAKNTCLKVKELNDTITKHCAEDKAGSGIVRAPVALLFAGLLAVVMSTVF